MKAFDIFQKNIGRAENLFALHRAVFQRGRPPKEWADILRAALIFAAAALDAYMHDKLVEIVPRVIKDTRNRLPGNLIDILKSNGITYESLIEMLFSGNHERRFREAIKKHYAERTIQDIGDIDKVVKNLGISDFWFSLAKAINKRKGRIRKINKEGVKDFIQSYIYRRHKIVHEADLWSGRMRLRPITVEFTKRGIERIKIFVEKFDAVVNQAYPA